MWKRLYKAVWCLINCLKWYHLSQLWKSKKKKMGVWCKKGGSLPDRCRLLLIPDLDWACGDWVELWVMQKPCFYEEEGSMNKYNRGPLCLCRINFDPFFNCLAQFWHCYRSAVWNQWSTLLMHVVITFTLCPTTSNLLKSMTRWMNDTDCHKKLFPVFRLYAFSFFSAFLL